MNKLFPLVILLTGLLSIGDFSGCSRGDETTKLSSGKKALYHCPMHPEVVSDKPGDCPICQMRLVPVDSAPDEHAGHSNSPDVSSPAASSDHASISVSSEREQMIGVRTAPVERREIVRSIRAGGRVAYDPELYNAIADYKEALNARARMGESADPVVKASVSRLRQMGVSDIQMDRLASGKDDPAGLLVSETSERVWIYAQIYEQDAAHVRPGQKMDVTSASLPGRRFSGTISSVDTLLDPQTRTLRARAVVSNAGRELKPEMFVEAFIHSSVGKRLAVPREAVLDTGDRQMVFVQSAPGRYDPRDVRLGAEADDFYEVLDGLSEDEIVVTSANFLIDSESRLKAAVSRAAGEHKH